MHRAAKYIQMLSLVLLSSLLAVAATGCTKTEAPSSSMGAQSILAPLSPAPPESAAPAPRESSTPALPETTTLLQEIVDAARLGKVLGCEYAVDGITIDDIKAAWGAADKSEYVASAKGTYYTFGEENLVFGANKGMLVFEIRSYAPRLASITRADVIGLLGNPEHTSTTGEGEVVIGYTLAYTGAASDMSPDEVKIKFAFPDDKDTSTLGHYMVLDPKQTANLMADDPGRDW